MARYTILPLSIILTACPFLTAEPKSEAVSDREAQVFAQVLLELSNSVSESYTRPVSNRELLAAGMSALYDAVGERLPEPTRKELLNSDGWSGTTRILIQCRKSLGQPEPIRGARAFVIAANGFAHATDPYCELLWSYVRTIAESEAGFGFGFTLEGVSTTRWLAYQIEAAGNWPNEASKTLPSPPTSPSWVVKRVIPGSPAAKGGLRPGDHITHLNGAELTAKTNATCFYQLTKMHADTAALLQEEMREKPTRFITLRVERAGSPHALELKLPRMLYSPESIAGVIRRRDGSWNFLLDREAKIGYIRLGAVESQADEEFEVALNELSRDGMRGLILDLRWCPGGYVDPTSRIAGALLPEGKVIATIETRSPVRGGRQIYTAQPPLGKKEYRTLPLMVLVNNETTGGGELIAAALQDHHRGIIVGQRTFGKANIMNLVTTPFHPLQFRVSTGYSLRPNGESRHRFPESSPTDEWGVKPDRGYEIPMTPDLSAKLRLQAERQAIRPADDHDAVPFDDPLADPQKMIAVKMMKRLLNREQ